MQPRGRLTPLPVLIIVGIMVSLTSCQATREGSPIWTTGHTRSADGVAISYQVAGDGPVALVFVHGWLGDRSYWKHQLDHFAGTHRVVALDLGGHGDSGLDRDQWTYRAFGEDVAAVVRSLELTRVVLIGHSMGGPVILEAARLIPQQVIGLVAVDSLQDPEAPGVTDEAINRFVTPFKTDFESAVRTLVGRAMFVPGSDSVLKAWIVDDMASAPPAVGVGALRSNMLWPTTTRSEALDAIRAPVRLINSDLFPTDSAATDRHGMEVVIMPGAGHFVMLEEPETFNEHLSDAIADFTR